MAKCHISDPWNGCAQHIWPFGTRLGQCCFSLRNKYLLFLIDLISALPVLYQMAISSLIPLKKLPISRCCSQPKVHSTMSRGDHAEMLLQKPHGSAGVYPMGHETMQLPSKIMQLGSQWRGVAGVLEYPMLICARNRAPWQMLGLEVLQFMQVNRCLDGGIRGIRRH